MKSSHTSADPRDPLAFPSESRERNAVDEAAESFVERLRAGERPSLSEYERRYPNIAHEIRDLFPVLANLEQAADASENTIRSSGLQAKMPLQLGEYRILGRIGQGGMGIVYEAEHATLRRRVALKVISGGSLNAKRLQRFHLEARAAGRLHHTNIVPVFEVGEDHGVHYYSMQFIRGQSLDLVIEALRKLRQSDKSQDTKKPKDHDHGLSAHNNKIAISLLSGVFEAPIGDPHRSEDTSQPRLDSYDSIPTSHLSSPQVDLAVSSIARIDSETNKSRSRSQSHTSDDERYYDRVARIGLQVADALGYAHSQGVIHRDIKPANLILDTCGVVWVTDFGLATQDDEDLTRTGDLIGTLAYMAPERLSGQSTLRADIYSLGLTLYELCTLEPAFHSTDRAQLIHCIANDNPVPPRRRNPRIPRDLETIILKAIDKLPARRYQAADELADDLRLFLNDIPVRARRATIFERLWRFSRRNPITAALMACVLFLSFLVFVGTMWFGISTHQQSQQLAIQTKVAKSTEREALNLLYDFSRTQAASTRRNSTRSPRGEGIAAIAKARSLLPRLNQSLENLNQAYDSLRNDAVACLAHSDLKVLKTWQVAPGWTSSVIFDSKFERYAQTNELGDVVLRRVDDDQEIIRFPTPGYPVWTILFSPDDQYLAALAHPPTLSAKLVQVWNVQTGELVIDESMPQSFGRFAFSQDSQQFAVGRKENKVRIYDLPSGKVNQDRDCEFPILGMRYDKQNRKIAISDATGYRFCILDVDGKPPIILETSSYVREFAWSPDGLKLFVGCEHGDIQIYDTTDFSKEPRTFRGHSGAVVRLDINSEGDRLMSSAWDNTTRLWNVDDGRVLLQTEGKFLSGRFSQDGRKIGFSTRKKQFGIWEVLDRGPMISMANQANARYSLAYLPGDPRILISMSNLGLEFWNTALGRLESSMPIKQPSRVAVAPDGGSLFVIGVDGIQRWPIEHQVNQTGILLGPPEALSDQRVSVGFTHPVTNGLQLALPGPTAGTLIQLDDPLNRIELGAQFNRWSMAICPDGQWVATGAWNGLGVQIWDSQTGALVDTLDRKSDKSFVQFSPDGKRLAISSGEVLSLYEVGTWRLIAKRDRDGEDGWPGQAMFSPDGSMIVAPCTRDLYQLLDSQQLRRLAILEPPESSSVGPVAFSPDGLELAIASDGMIHVWRLADLRGQLAEIELDWAMPALSLPKPLKHDSVSVTFQTTR